MKRLLHIIVLIASTAVIPLFSQTDDETLIEKLRADFKKEYLSIGFVLQVVGDGQIERIAPGTNGFNLSNMRLSVSGKLDKGFSYLVRTNFINSPAVLDAKMGYRISDHLSVNAGLFKSPFSKEFLTPADAIDMVNRSQVVSALAPNRQIGFQASSNFAKKVVVLSAGVFNGNRFGGNVNDNNDFMYAGRVSIFPVAESSDKSLQLELGLNTAFSYDRNVQILGERFSGERFLMGGDIRFQTDVLLLSGEYIRADLDGVVPSGFHATTGIMMDPKNQILLRFDRLKPYNDAPNSDLLILGWNLWPSQATELQLNYVVNVDYTDLKYHQLLINAQVAF